MLRTIEKNLSDPLQILLKQWLPLLVIQIISLFATLAVVAISLFTLLMPLIVGLIKHESAKTLFHVYLPNILIALGIIFVLALLFHVWKVVGMIVAIGGGAQTPLGLGYVMKRGFALMIPILFVMIFTTLPILGGMFLFAVPGIMLALGLAFVYFIRIFEGVPLSKAIATSWEITKGYRMSILGRFLLAYLIIMGVYMGMAIISIVPLMNFFLIPAQLVLSFVMAPYILAYLYCIYADIRKVRTEVYSMKCGLATLLILFGLFGIGFIGSIVWSLMYAISKM